MKLMAQICNSSVNPAVLAAAITALIACKTTASDLTVANGTPVLDPSDPVAQATVALRWAGETGGQCSGTLVAPTTVVTAAHCFVYAGATGLSVHFGAQAERGPAVAAASFRLYSQDQNGQIDDIADVAVITLAAPAPVGFTPVPVIAATATLAVGNVLTLAGYGSTTTEGEDFGTLRKGNAPISAIVGTIPNAPSNELQNILATAPAESADADSCFGDSGGPAFAVIADQLVLAGVNSGGNGANCGNGSNYTDARFYSTWIQQKIVQGTAGGPPWVQSVNGLTCKQQADAGNCWQSWMNPVCTAYCRMQ